MSLLTWLFQAEVTVAGHPILWREVIGNLFGLASAVLGMRRLVWAWPVGMAGNAMLLTVFLGVAFDTPQQQTLLGQAGRQVFFLATSVYGWWRWQGARARLGQAGPAVEPRWATAGERAGYLTLALPAVAVTAAVFAVIGAGFPAPWWFFVADAWIFVGSILATYAMARGWVDFWLCWIAVDLVGVPLLLHSGFYPSAVLYAVYAGFVGWGFVVWRRLAGAQGAGQPDDGPPRPEPPADPRDPARAAR
jgi:nicotinamide mononucleotide transporter